MANTLGDVLIAIRDRADLTQDELAARSGVSQASISLYEQGRTVPPTDRAARLLDALHATADERTIVADLLAVGPLDVLRAVRALADVRAA